MAYKHIFGPVPSRRLGISLGIDLVPAKTCMYNCVYCECGKTTNLTCERREYVPTAEVIAELEEYLRPDPEIDYVTLSGSGEPTLHTGIGEIIAFLKERFPRYRVAVLTSGALLSEPTVRDDLMKADLVLPSLDAASETCFRRVNRPVLGIAIEDVVRGLIAFSREFHGDVWLEVFVVPGKNDAPEELERLKDAIGAIDPERVQLNTLDRPGAELWVRPATRASLEAIASFLGGDRVEVVAPSSACEPMPGLRDDVADLIMETILRRPCTARDLSRIAGLRRSEVGKYLTVLREQGRVEAVRGERGIFFRAV